MPASHLVAMTSTRTLTCILVGAALAALNVSCKDNGPVTIGPPSQLVLLPGGNLGAPANTNITSAIQISVQDAQGHPIANQTITLTVTAGGGSLTSTSATSDANGTVTLPTWKLGKAATPQTVTATLNNITLQINATVTTLYSIVVRFFGDPMDAAQQALFTNAASRISGFITGDVIDANAQNLDLTPCGLNNQQLNELVDDVVIYASIQQIDGPGKILAQAGPCYYRNAAPAGQPQQFMPAVGSMQFDAADINTLAGAGSLQEVITHEMLHVLGFGVLWEDRGILAGKDTPDPRYTGAQGRQGCVSVSGTVTCATSVPVEATGGAGTANSHWRESTFDTELMTGFIDASPNPISLMTVMSMADFGYGVNTADFDSYVIPGGLLRASAYSPTHRLGWERRLPMNNLLVLEKDGSVRVVARP